MESSRVPLSGRVAALLERDRDTKTNLKGMSSDLSAQRIQFNTPMSPVPLRGFRAASQAWVIAK